MSYPHVIFCCFKMANKYWFTYTYYVLYVLSALYIMAFKSNPQSREHPRFSTKQKSCSWAKSLRYLHSDSKHSSHSLKTCPCQGSSIYRCSIIWLISKEVISDKICANLKPLVDKAVLITGDRLQYMRDSTNLPVLITRRFHWLVGA